MTRYTLVCLLASLLLTPLFAEAPPEESKNEEVDVEKLKEKYWLRGGEAGVGVVQNRMYRKRHNIELGLLGGSVSGDPFLSTYNYGVTVGFHFTEFLAAHAIYWSASSSGSSALKTLENDTRTTANVNRVKSYMGGEGRASLLYGKLSLIGEAILYFDAYFSLGAGKIATESGDNFLLSVGLGQQIHISQLLALTIDFKFIHYNETIIGKGNLNLGQNLGRRANLSSSIMIGLSFFLDPLGSNEKG